MTHRVPISVDTSHDPLARMRVFNLATELGPDCFVDAQALIANPITEEIGGQLYAAVGSISANISDGYSRSSGKDRARIFEIALGSVRESMSWYRSSEPVLGASVAENRRDRLEEMRRLLLAIIPRERGRTMRSFRRCPQSALSRRSSMAVSPESAKVLIPKSFGPGDHRWSMLFMPFWGS